MKFHGIKINRIVIEADGYAVSPETTNFNIKPDIVFKRNDGWTLGAPKELAYNAYELWKNEWVEYSLGGEWIDIKNY
jgi:hypothetical protein